MRTHPPAPPRDSRTAFPLGDYTTVMMAGIFPNGSYSGETITLNVLCIIYFFHSKLMVSF